jgi:DNA-binding MarR family transcriptional regulator
LAVLSLVVGTTIHARSIASIANIANVARTQDEPGGALPPRTANHRPRAARFEGVATPERETYLLVRHASGTLIKGLAAALAPAGVTPEQFHVLRILQDAGPGGLPCSVVAERAVSGDPDVTRLLDRLEGQRWASRARDSDDRRVVTARITKEGLRLLGRIEDAVAELHARQFSGLKAREVSALRDLLDRLAPGDEPR